MIETPQFPLEQAWIYKVSVLSDRVARNVSVVLAEVSNLNLSQWRVIAAVADKQGRTASQVVAVTPMDKGIVSRAVASLVERGLLKRMASKTDGRLSHLLLTTEGNKIYRKIVTRLDESGASGRISIPEGEQARLNDLLDEFLGMYTSLGSVVT